MFRRQSIVSESGTETCSFTHQSRSRDLAGRSGHMPAGYAARREFGSTSEPQTTTPPSKGSTHFHFRLSLSSTSSRRVQFEHLLHSRHGRVEAFTHLLILYLATAGLLERVSPLRACRYTKDLSPQLLSAIGANASQSGVPDVGMVVLEISCLVAPSGLLKRPAHASTREMGPSVDSLQHDHVRPRYTSVRRG